MKRPRQSLPLTVVVVSILVQITLTPRLWPIPQGDLSIRLEEVAGGLTSPLALVSAGDGSDRLFVVDQAGKILVIKHGTVQPVPFLDVTSKLVPLNAGYDERGLLGLTFHPDYARNGRFFVRYSAPRESTGTEPCDDPTGFIVGCHKEVLAEYRVDAGNPDVASSSSEVILFQVDKPQFNHNGGDLAFGPDGFLYFTLGDGGGANDGLADDPPSHGPGGNGQNFNTPLGSILRIDVDGGAPYVVPPDNPFVGVDGLDEIFAYGFRNPYRFSFDRGGSRELFVPDVGQNLFEEVNVVVKGGNYGWAIREGAHCFDALHPTVPPVYCETAGLIDPIAEYSHSDGGLAIVAGFVYRGSGIPELMGKYVFGDFSRDFGPTGSLYYLDAEGDRSKIFLFHLDGENNPLGLFVKGFGEDSEGELYLLASSGLGPSGTGGKVFRIAERFPRQVPGDCNGDGKLDISDAVCTLGALFLGHPAAFPCGDGMPDDPANLGLLDWQADTQIDIADAIGLLQFLFSGGPAHPLAVPGLETTGCVPMPGCPDRAVGCPSVSPP